MGKSAIPYLDAVINVTVGCSGKGCQAQCWARDLHNKRHKAFLEGKKMPKQYEKPFNVVQFFPERLQEALHRKKPTVYGVSFTGDLFDEQVRIEWQAQVFKVVHQRPEHMFIFLTKQPQNIPKGQNFAETMPNAWFGTTITTQADWWRAVELLGVPGKKWLSLEPMLGNIDLRLINPCGVLPFDLVVVGAESGPKRRPMPLEWAYSVVDQCKSAGVKIYIKQLSINGKVSHNPEEWPEALRVRELPWRVEQVLKESR